MPTTVKQEHEIMEDTEFSSIDLKKITHSRKPANSPKSEADTPRPREDTTHGAAYETTDGSRACSNHKAESQTRKKEVGNNTQKCWPP